MNPEKYNALTHTKVVCDSSCSSHSLINPVKTGLSDQLTHFFTKLFDTADWPPRWHCGNWTDLHGWLYILSDLTIWAAYFAIPLLLFRILNKRKDIPFSGIVWLFISFILLCGTTHLIDAVIFWWPAYRISALVRFFTALVSIFTVYALYKIMPIIYKLRTAQQLEAEIDERKKAEQAVHEQQLLQEATEELMRKKDEFMSIASHELKTPITSVKASLQVLERMTYKNESMLSARPFIERSVRQVDKLTGIIHDLLDVTRIQAGRLEVVKTEFNVMQLVQESVELCIAPGDKHNVKIDGDPLLMVNADRVRIDQVMCNLLTNAIKYSPDTPEINISFKALENGQVKFAITDHGIGIPAENLENIFDRFYRVENTSQNYSGIGLGLYISSEVIKRHGGEVGVESELGKGSTFWFSIPGGLTQPSPKERA